MYETIKKLFMHIGVDDFIRRTHRFVFSRRRFIIRFPTYRPHLQPLISNSADPVRAAALALAIATIDRQNIPGAMAELGVYRGETSCLIHAASPERTLYLFDTFEGFPVRDKKNDNRFQDTNLDVVRKNVGDLRHVIIKKGYFPETAYGLETETFAFVLLDADLYNPTMAGLTYFYSRLQPGGYIFAHDYNSPESDHAVSKAVDLFMADKPEKLVELPDSWGTIVIRKA